MKLSDFKKLNLPDGPGVYFFKKTAQQTLQENPGAESKTAGLEPEILYIGKATSLRDRVRSYFSDDLIQTRGRLLVDMVVQADTITFQETDSVLEAFILESELIKKYLPRYNTKEKDNKSFNYVVITKEDYPRVLVVRGRNLEKAGTTKQEQIESLGFEYTDVFGPFPFGSELREAMKLIRRIFPYRDKCMPFVSDSVQVDVLGVVSDDKNISSMRDIQRVYSRYFRPTSTILSDGSTIFKSDTNATALQNDTKKGAQNSKQKGKPCFNRSIGLCPGVCTGEISKEEYAVQISHIRNFFKGKKQVVVDELKKEMLAFAKEQKFEEANEVKKTLGALAHIHDISMIKKDAEFGHIGKRGRVNGVVGIAEVGVDGYSVASGKEFTLRAEAYDIAHMSGKDMVGVMVVMHDGDFAKDQYKKFNIREIKSSNDTGALKQVLERRFSHIGSADKSSNWPIPTHIVLDGGVAQLNVAEEVLNTVIQKNSNTDAESIEILEKIRKIYLVAVTKDDTHKAKGILRSSRFNFEHKDSREDKDDTNAQNGVIFDDGDIISLNQECHRFAIATHRKRRSLSRGL